MHMFAQKLFSPLHPTSKTLKKTLRNVCNRVTSQEGTWNLHRPVQIGIILLMDKILHQLIGSLSHYLQGFIHPRWCRILSINRMLVSLKKNKWTFLGVTMDSSFQASQWFLESMISRRGIQYPKSTNRWNKIIGGLVQIGWVMGGV